MPKTATAEEHVAIAEELMSRLDAIGTEPSLADTVLILGTQLEAHLELAKFYAKNPDFEIDEGEVE